ncbi:MAG: proprotein convertase P-domain-containing protein [Planctomycetota bacterium]|jgi:hypothetical protein
MTARNVLQRIVAILIVAVTASDKISFADTVYVYGGDFDLPIIDVPGPGSLVTEAIIDIPDDFIIHDLDVAITITHTNVFDLQLFLQSPAGTRICLNMFDFEDEFGVYPNYTDTIFDDEAQLSIKQADAPFTGPYRPIEPFLLSEFDGEQTPGQWSLQIYDMYDWDTGTLNHFELIIATPEPTTVVLLILGTAMLTLFNPRRNS